MSFRPPPISNPKQAMLLAGEMLILKTVLEAFFMGLCVFLPLYIFDTLCARSTLASAVGSIFSVYSPVNNAYKSCILY